MQSLQCRQQEGASKNWSILPRALHGKIRPGPILDAKIKSTKTGLARPLLVTKISPT